MGVAGARTGFFSAWGLIEGWGALGTTPLERRLLFLPWNLDFGRFGPHTRFRLKDYDIFDIISGPHLRLCR